MLGLGLGFGFGLGLGLGLVGLGWTKPNPHPNPNPNLVALGAAQGAPLVGHAVPHVRRHGRAVVRPTPNPRLTEAAEAATPP